MTFRLQAITQDDAVKAWNSRKNKSELPDLSVDGIGNPEDEYLSDLELEELQEKLEDIKFEYKSANLKRSAGNIDAAVVQPLHSFLSAHATPYQLSQLGFWCWLSNIALDGFFWEFINWRFDESEQQVNWAITTPGQIIEVYFYRAWLRGHIMKDDSLSDPYLYATKGHSDMWRSHILRQEFGRDKEFVKAFLDHVYDKNNKAKVGTKELRTILIPSIRAWCSGASFSHLTYDESKDLLIKLHKEGL